MKCWTTLLLGALGLELAISATLAGQPQALPKVTPLGTAYVTQLNNLQPNADYDNSFGDNWQSVRTFRLLSPLDKPLKVYIEHRPKVPGLFQPQYETYVQDGLTQWGNALDNRLRFTLTNKAREADITIDWVPNFSDRYVAGLTTYSVGHASVEIKTLGIPDKDIKCNIIHELGHALGISGHSYNPGDVMVGMRKWHRDNVPYDPKLSSRDTQAIRRLYSLSWQKGEDLFSAEAQRMPVLASSQATLNRSAGTTAPNASHQANITPPAPLKPSEQTQPPELSPNAFTASAQTRTEPATADSLTPKPSGLPVQKQTPQRPRFTQIFPKP